MYVIGSATMIIHKNPTNISTHLKQRQNIDTGLLFEYLVTSCLAHCTVSVQF